MDIVQLGQMSYNEFFMYFVVVESEDRIAARFFMVGGLVFNLSEAICIN